MDAAESNRSWVGRRCELTDRAAIRSVMPALGIQAAQLRPKVTTAAPVGTPVAEAPGRKWCRDITYISAWAGVIHLAIVLDSCTKKVVGHAMACHVRTSLVFEAIDMTATPTCHTQPHNTGNDAAPPTQLPHRIEAGL